MVEGGSCKPGNGREVGILGATGRCKPPPASMEDLIYIHWRKMRKTVYQKSYRAGSATAEREREREVEIGRMRDKSERDGKHGRRRRWCGGDAGGKGGAG